MPRLSTLKNFLDTLYDEPSYSVKSKEPSGLITRGDQFTKKIALCVNATKDTINQAIKAKCNLIIAHNLESMDREKENMLNDTNTALYVVGLPMDTLNIYGTDWLLARSLGLNPINHMDPKQGKKDEKLGLYGMSRIESFTMFVKRINWLTHEKSRVYRNNTADISRIAVLAGIEPTKENLDLAESIGCSLFLCNTAGRELAPYAEDIGMDFVVANYTATERLALNALKAMLDDKFSSETIILNEPDY